MTVREQILAQAARLFAGRGFSGTSVDRIADAVGIRKASILYHFGTKDELRESVLAEMLAHWNDVLPELLLIASRQERFDAVMESLCSFFLEEPDRARLLLRETLDRPQQMQGLLRKFVRPWIDVIAEQLAHAKERGIVHEDVDPEAYAVHVMNLVVGGIAVLDKLNAVLPSDSALGSTRERYIKELVRIAKAALYREHPEE